MILCRTIIKRKAIYIFQTSNIVCCIEQRYAVFYDIYDLFYMKFLFFIYFVFNGSITGNETQKMISRNRKRKRKKERKNLNWNIANTMFREKGEEVWSNSNSNNSTTCITNGWELEITQKRNYQKIPFRIKSFSLFRR